MSIAVVLGGTSVPLPDAQSMSGVSADSSNTAFTVLNTGTYLVQYNLRTTNPLFLSTRVTSNGTPVAGLTDSTSAARTNWSASSIVSLTAGDTLSLQMFGLLGMATLDGPSGANLTIVQVD